MSSIIDDRRVRPEAPDTTRRPSQVWSTDRDAVRWYALEWAQETVY